MDYGHAVYRDHASRHGTPRRNHAGDTYLMYDPDTQRVHTYRDVIWLKRIYFEKAPNPPDVGGEPLILVYVL
jgi:hypothetical protein